MIDRNGWMRTSVFAAWKVAPNDIRITIDDDVAYGNLTVSATLTKSTHRHAAVAFDDKAACIGGYHSSHDHVVPTFGRGSRC